MATVNIKVLFIFILNHLSTCSPMGITGVGLTTVQVAGAATVQVTTAPSTLPGGQERPASASLLAAGDTLSSSTLWCR